MQFILVDNYDSFTWNLYHYLGDIGVDTTVILNDKATPGEILARKPDAIILSPGPCAPDQAGVCLEIIDQAVDTPIFGVCLGFQAIGQAYGARVVRAPEVVHGQVRNIRHFGGPLFAGIDANFPATRYHSLMLEAENFPECLTVTATTDDIVAGIAHVSRPHMGVLFHPESIMTDAGKTLLANFCDIVGNHRPRRNYITNDDITNRDITNG